MKGIIVVAQAAATGIAGGSACAPELDVLGAILAAGPVVKGVMLILLVFSVLSWAIIISKLLQLRRVRRHDAEFYRVFWMAPDLAQAQRDTGHLNHSPAAAVFRQALAAASAPATRGGAVSRALRRALAEEGQRLSRSLSFLATCGNTAPFIGLFGTVWGIMTSFHHIGLKGSASLATVAPGIAEALIATAAGLAAAIPAVIAYNYFLGQVRQLQTELGNFARDLDSFLAKPAGAASAQDF